MGVSPVIQAEPIGVADSLLPPQVRVGEPFIIVIFGATGALTSSKLLPAKVSVCACRLENLGNHGTD